MDTVNPVIDILFLASLVAAGYFVTSVFMTALYCFLATRRKRAKQLEKLIEEVLERGRKL